MPMPPEVDDRARRTPPRPPGPPVVRMTWDTLLFLHWPVEAERLRALVPEGVEIDTFDGSAWVGLVPFTMPRFRPLGMPVPMMASFHECNVRTYVVRDGVPGVWFFSLDAASRLAVWGARTFWHLPYKLAAITLEREGDEIDYRVDRRDGPPASLRCRWRIGPKRPRTTPGDLDHFLTHRLSLFSRDRRGRIRRGAIDHPPWSLREAEVVSLEDSLLPAAGIEVDRDLERNPPLAWHADPLEVEAWWLRVA